MYADTMTLLEILFGTGFVVGVAVAVLVYLHCVRRGVSLTSRLVRALICGGCSFGSFLVPYVFEQELRYLYFQVLKPRPIAVHPREWLLVNLIVGLVTGGVLMALYFAGSRFQSGKQTEMN